MLATTEEARVRICALLSERLDVEVPDPETDLIQAGLIDSLALVTLIVGLEDTFGAQLPLDRFDIDHFRSVHAMVGFLADAGVLSAA